MKRFFLLVLLTLAAGPAGAQIPGLGIDIGKTAADQQGLDNPDPDAALSVSAAWSSQGVHPGGQIGLAIVLDIAEPFHINTHKPGEGYIPTTLMVTASDPNVLAIAPIYPAGTKVNVKYANVPLDAYQGRVVIYVPLRVGSDVPTGLKKIELELTYQMCDETQCYLQASRSIEVELNVIGPQTPIEPANVDLFSGVDLWSGSRLAFPLFGWDFTVGSGQVLLIWLLAAVGGFLLNFTPCVLPLIPIKIMSLSRAAEHGSPALLLGGVMSLGVLTFWLVLGGVMASISSFKATNQLFQYPAFTLGVGIVIVIMAVGMMGLFAVRLPQWIYRINPTQDSIHGSFGFGIMTAILSTPCTAPLMGAAAAWAVTQSTAITLSTFGAIGLGMALPYFVLAAMPRLVNRMPRTGPASNLIKQVMGLLMFAAAAYFVGNGIAGLSVDPPDPPSRAFWWAVAIAIGAAGAWLSLRTLGITRSLARRAIFCGLGVLFIAAGGWVGIKMTEAGPIRWTYYTPQRLAEATEDRKIIVLDFTAGWCLNCQALEQTYLHRENVVALLNSPDVVPMKVDLTGKNEAGNELLSSLGRRSIPYLVVLDGRGQAIFASDAYTDAQVIGAIEQARRSAEQSY